MLKWLYNKLFPPTEPDVDTDSTTISRAEAKAAVSSARAGYRMAIKRQPKVERVVTALNTQNEINHFGDLIERTMKGNG